MEVAEADTRAKFKKHLDMNRQGIDCNRPCVGRMDTFKLASWLAYTWWSEGLDSVLF